MSSDAHAWLDIADTDIDAARRSLVQDPEPNIPAAAYHCQQAVEKLIKALLVDLGLPYLRGSGGHDLRRLVAALPNTHPLLGDAVALGAHIALGDCFSLSGRRSVHGGTSPGSFNDSSHSQRHK